MRLLILAAMGLALIAGPGAQAASAEEPEAVQIIDFLQEKREWYPVNDGVMGGISRSRLQQEDGAPGVFSGTLSLANNGGFASVRTLLPKQDLSACAGIQLRVRGDGRTYQLRFRTNDRFDGPAYRALFETRADTWTTVRLPFTAFKPTFRGRVLSGYPPLDTGSLRQLTIMLADKQAGPFRLEIEAIGAYVSD